MASVSIPLGRTVPDESGDVSPFDSESNVQQGSQSKSSPAKYKSGVAVILNNQNFASFAERKGSSHDELAMYKLLNVSNFETITSGKSCKDLTCEDMREKLKEVFHSNNNAVRCFVCVILSYGREGFVYGTKNKDDILSVDEIISYFKGDKCEWLIDVPKLFFIQTCPEKLKETHDSPSPIVDEPNNKGSKIPVEADLLLVHSCIPGDLQDEKKSCFISALTEAFDESLNDNKDGKIDVLRALVKMNAKIVKKLDSSSDTKGRYKLPYIWSTLRNDVDFKS